jgi:hypothetical protein
MRLACWGTAKRIPCTARMALEILWSSVGEILIVAGAMLPGAVATTIELLHGRIAVAALWSSISLGPGLLAIGILLVRRQERSE